MADFTPAQIEQYCQARLDPFKLHHSKGSWWRSICPVHKGSNHTQFAVNFEEGNFRCFSCDAKGGSIYALEQLMLKEDFNGRSPMHNEVQAALERILQTPITKRVYAEDLSGERKPANWDISKAQDRYLYTDEDGFELYTVYRFVDRHGNKKTPAARPCPCQRNADAECLPGCVGGRIWNLDGVDRVLYRLPDVMQAMFVFVVEGEKNANDLSREMARFIAKKGGFRLPDGTFLDRVAVTTNSHGASSWKKDYKYGPFFYRKTVVKLGDNDAAGRLHDKAACEDIAQFARHLYTLPLPVGEGEDVSDYLIQHSIEDFTALMGNRQEWAVKNRSFTKFTAEVEKPRTLLVKPSQLANPDALVGGDWLVDGFIERGTRGLVVAPPKTGKSLLFLEMVLCLATKRSFLGCRPYDRALKCAVISREDGPTIVHRRLNQLAASRGLSQEEVDQNIVVNTEQQSARFKVDRDADLEEMGDWLRAEGVEFCVIDVLNRLHDKAENSSDEMTRVMQRFDDLAARGGCQVCVIHHTNKAGGVKGSTSIEGWADYVVRLEQSLDDDAMKTLFLKTKLSGAVIPRTVRYWQSADLQQSRIDLVDMRPVSTWSAGRSRNSHDQTTERYQ